MLFFTPPTPPKSRGQLVVMFFFAGYNNETPSVQLEDQVGDSISWDLLKLKVYIVIIELE